MKAYVWWDANSGYDEVDVKIEEEKFKVGEVYFENERYQLIAEEKRNEEYFLVAEWKE